MDSTERISEKLRREYFAFDVKIGDHPRYGKNANWNNFKHPETKPGELGPKTYWYAYETESGSIGVKISIIENVFFPKVYCYIDPAGKTFEEAVFEFWNQNV